MLGRLARWLRILGYDTVFSPRFSDSDIVRIGLRERRIVLTRDRGLIGRPSVTQCILVRSQKPREQLRQVCDALTIDLNEGRIFTRCPMCNRTVHGVEKEQAKMAVPRYVYRTRERFSRCPECGRFFWHGTHYERTIAQFRNIFEGE